MNPNVITTYKNIGETPLEALERLRREQPEYQDAILSYIGRLDPMAEGAMLVLVGEENKHREKYLSLDKEYECEVLFGIATDTHDVLGLVTEIAIADSVTKEMIEEKLKLFLGKRMQKYPAYSSKPVGGKALHEWAREGRLDEIAMPQKEITIYSIELLDFYHMQKEALKKTIAERLALVEGDFRQKDILARWEETLGTMSFTDFPVAKIKVSCSSGTYLRVIASELGKMLDLPALAMSIKRTRIGK
jgi:tRNA pseudouridine55 synthase